MTEDRSLLQRAAGGDAGAFEAFVEVHRQPVWRFVRSLTQDAAAAEDALQEAFLAAWRNAGTFRGEGSALGWLLTLARHALYRQFRQRAGAPERLESLESLAELGEAAGWGAEDPEEAFLTQDEVRRALAKLSLEDRELLLLRDVEGLGNEACASILSLGLPALKSRLHRARLRFVAHLRGEHHGH